MPNLANAPVMDLMTPNEFARMERLLAELLPDSNPQEEAALLQMHARLQAIYGAQSGLQASRDRLMALRSRTGQ